MEVPQVHPPGPSPLAASLAFLADLALTQYLGGGDYAFGPLNWEERLALQEEKQSLEQKLAEVPVWESRLTDLLKERETREARKERI